ncbi:MAG: septal ring lytic transglycosylase RlpA family protein [Immundisolibacter sp.]
MIVAAVQEVSAGCGAQAADIGRALAVLLLVVLAACAGPGSRRAPDFRQDGPPLQPIDVSRIPDAVPRDEPLCQPCLRPYEVDGVQYRPLASAAGYQARGTASWYGREFHGRPTANGERYDMLAMTAAHPTLPIPSYVRVTHLDNGRSVVVRINDRGPFRRGRLIDLSYAAAAKLGMVGHGSAPVLVQAVMPFDRRQTPLEPAPVDVVYLQVGAFGDAGAAQRVAGRLRAAALTPVQVRVEHRDGRFLHKVRLGPLAPAMVDRARARLAALGLPALPVP